MQENCYTKQLTGTEKRMEMIIFCVEQLIFTSIMKCCVDNTKEHVTDKKKTHVLINRTIMIAVIIIMVPTQSIFAMRVKDVSIEAPVSGGYERNPSTTFPFVTFTTSKERRRRRRRRTHRYLSAALRAGLGRGKARAQYLLQALSPATRLCQQASAKESGLG